MAVTPPGGRLSEQKDGSHPLTQMGSPFFQMMMDNSPDLIWAKDMDDRFIFVNRASCEIILKCDSTSEPIGKTDFYFANREKEKGFLHTFGETCLDSDKQVKESGEPGRFIEEGYVRGKYLVLDVHKAPFYDDNGDMVGTVGSARDITAERAIEKKLKKSEERFRRMADFLPVPIAEFDFDFNLFYANRAGLNYFGYTREDYEKYPSVSRLVPKYKTSLVRSWLEDLRQGKERSPFEMQFVKKDGSYIYGMVNASPIRKNGKVVAIRACFTDLSDRRSAEVALRENETRFRTLFNGFNDAVFVHPFADRGFKNFVEVNDVACDWYGYTRDELLEMTPQDLILDPEGKGMGSEESRQNLKMVRKRTIETLNKKKNNEIFPVEISSSIFEFHGEQMILSTVRDITDRRQTEKERADAVKFAAEQEKYALVGQVAGKMAHDFNNILGGIMGNAEFSLMDCKDPDIKNTLEIILDQTLRGKNLTKNLVAFARDQEPKEEFFSLNEKMELVLSLMKKDLERVRVVRQFSSNLPELLADPGMIEHALVNLIQNAVHAMSKKANPELRIATAHSVNCLVIEIEDNGCGIPEAYHDRIYTPSFTLKGSKDIRGAYETGIRGTGYGMSNVKKYIQKHRGGIAFTSSENKGTAFTISIPLINKELTRKEKIRMARKQVIQGKKILLVEDEEAISEVQRKILSQAPFNHRVVVAARGQEAIEAFDREDFDLISLDYILPGRLNGMDVYSYIRRTNARVPVIFLSGNIAFIESMKEMQARDNRIDHLSKPCENIVYADTVNEWLYKIFS
ncbi:MAG: PAS domain S-box protein [Desulfobacterales bacterium]|nr:PAS domain S-box protein [Desulfobacterales bacterium]